MNPRYLCALTLFTFIGIGCSNPAAVHLTRGDKALAAGRFGEAISAYNHARELSPTDPAAQLGLMKARAAMVAEQPLRITAETSEDLRYEAQFLTETDPAHAALYLTALANVASRNGQVEEAKAKYEAALKADPSSVVANTALGVFYLGQKDGADKAKDEFEKVLKQKPDAVVALVGLGQIALGDGKPEVAADRLEAALKSGDDFTARMLLGSARQKQNKSAEAAAEFLRASQLDPRSAEALRSLGQALLADNKPEEAEKPLRQAAAISPDPQTVLALGFALQRQNKADQALGLFNAVLQQNAADPPALFGAGAALEQLGKKDEAALAYRKLGALPATQGPGGQFIAQLQQQAAQRLAALGKPAAPAVAPLNGAVAPPQ